jgi:diguanylate cyclase (GGDEF)-like protein
VSAFGAILELLLNHRRAIVEVMTVRDRIYREVSMRDVRVRDAWIIFAAAVVTYIISTVFDPFEKLIGFVQHHEDLQLDELFWVLLVVCVGALIYSIRRLRELWVAVKARHAAELEAQRLALHDPLTGLPNRRFFAEKLEEVLGHCTPDKRAAVLMLDLNHFKALNDVYGHAASDKALIEFAGRISKLASAGTLIARVGGDEFAVVQPTIASLEETTAFVHRIVASTANRVMIDETWVALGVGIGIAIAPDNGIEPDRIMRRADLALYCAKAEGGSLIRFFEADMDEFVERRATIERELRAALA